VAIQVGVGVVHDRAVWKNLWLLPLRDLVAFWVWFASFADHTVHWRGEVFILRNGKISPVHPQGSERLTAAKPDQDKVSAHS
jgi:ceramide glucosyltransferase